MTSRVRKRNHEPLPTEAYLIECRKRRPADFRIELLNLPPTGKPNNADDTTRPSFKSRVNTFLTSEGHRPIGEDVEGWDGPFVPTGRSE